MAIDGGDGDRRKLTEERLMRGRKIDQMRGRKKELCAERERERKMVKKLYAHATVPMHICTGTIVTCIYTQVCTG